MLNNTFEGHPPAEQGETGKGFHDIWIVAFVLIACATVLAVIPAFIVSIHHCCHAACCRRRREKNDRKERVLMAECFAGELAQTGNQSATSESDDFPDTSLDDLNVRLTCAIQEQRLKALSRDRKYSNGGHLVRLTSLYFYAVFWIGLVFLTVVSLVDLPKLFGIADEKVSNGTKTLYFQIGGIMLVVVSWLFVCIESCFAVEWKRLSRLKSTKEISKRMKEITYEPPHISISASAYHYEQTVRQVRRHQRWQTEKQSEKVVTHNFKQPFSYRFWQDLSMPEIKDVSGRGLVKIDIHQSVLVGDQQTKVAFDDELERIRHLDKQVDLEVKYTGHIPDVELLAFDDADSRPCWISPFCYWAAVLMMMAWPYRRMFDRSTSHAELTIVKIIYCNQPSFGSTGANKNTSTLSAANSTGVGSQSPPATTQRDVIVTKLDVLRNLSTVYGDGDRRLPRLAEPDEVLQASRTPVNYVSNPVIQLPDFSFPSNTVTRL